MIDEIDTLLENWVIETFKDIKVYFTPPNIEETKQSICFYLFEVFPASTGTRIKNQPVQFTLRYLVYPKAKTPKQTHNLLGKLLDSAIKNKDFEIEKEPLPVEVWNSFNLAPSPSFILRTPFNIVKEEKIAPPVRQPMIINQTTIQPLRGQIFVNEIPLVSAKVIVPKLKISTKTDSNGYFNFSSMPNEPKDKDLIIQTKIGQFKVSTDQLDKKENLLMIHLNSED